MKKEVKRREERNLVRRSFKVPDEDWKTFKKLANKNGSNASVELRKFIKDYNKENYQVQSEEKVEKALEYILNQDKEVLDALAQKKQNE